MNTTEMIIYAAENKAIIHVQFVLCVMAALVIFGMALYIWRNEHVLRRTVKQNTELTRVCSERKARIVTLEAVIKQNEEAFAKGLADSNAKATKWKMELHRKLQILEKTESALIATKLELDNRTKDIGYLRDLISAAEAAEDLIVPLTPSSRT